MVARPRQIRARQTKSEATRSRSLSGGAGYILVLFAMRLAPISHVAPIREMSLMIGLFFGAKFLGEGDMVRRITGSAIIAGGVVALALG
jgi:uncharacterized membrane protein